MEKPKKRFIFKKWDILFLCIALALAALSAFLFLGESNTPKTSYTTKTRDENGAIVGDYMTFTKNPVDPLAEIWVYGTSAGRYLDNGLISVYMSHTEGVRGDWVGSFEITSDKLFSFVPANIYIAKDKELYHFITFETSSPDISLGEVVFITKAGSQLPPLVVSGKYPDRNYAALCDEQLTFTKNKTAYNTLKPYERDMAIGGMEIKNGQYVSRHSILPLSQGLTALGMQMFGENLFGIRFMSALFGVLTVGVVYVLARAIFKKTYLACITSGLYLLSGLSLTLLRTATMYNFQTFFILAGFLAILLAISGDYELSAMNLLFLGLGGVSFGFAVSISLWSIAPLLGGALLYCFYLVDRSAHIRSLTSEQQAACRTHTILFIVSVVAALLVIPLLIYGLCYLITFQNKYTYESVLSYVQFIPFFEHLFKNQSYVLKGLTAVSGGNIFPLWLIGIGGQKVTTYQLMQNIMVFAGALGSGIYFIVNLILSKVRGISSEKLHASNTRILQLLTIGFVSCLIPYVFQYQGVFAGAFLPASVFFIGYLTLLMRNCIFQFKRPLLTVQNQKLKITTGILAVTLFFVLAIAVFGVCVTAFLGL